MGQNHQRQGRLKSFAKQDPISNCLSSSKGELAPILLLMWSVFKLAAIGVSLFLALSATVVDHLIFIGRGVRTFHIPMFLLASGGLLWLSARMRSQAGDWVFLLWGLFTLKWVGELVWSYFRQDQSEMVFSMDPGIPLTAFVGIESQYVAILLTVVLGGVLILVPTGWAVGLVLLWGGLCVAILTLYAQFKGEQEKWEKGDQLRMAQESEEGEGGHGDHRKQKRSSWVRIR